MERKIEKGEIMFCDKADKKLRLAGDADKTFKCSACRLAELGDVKTPEEAALFVRRWAECHGRKALITYFGPRGKDNAMRYLVMNTWEGADDMRLLPLAYSPEKKPAWSHCAKCGKEMVGVTGDVAACPDCRLDPPLPPLGTLRPEDVKPGMILGHRCDGCVIEKPCKGKDKTPFEVDDSGCSRDGAGWIVGHDPWCCPLSQCYPDTGNGTWFPKVEEKIVPVPSPKVRLVEKPKETVWIHDPGWNFVPPTVPSDWKCPHCGRVVFSGKTTIEANNSHEGKWIGCTDCFHALVGLARKVPLDVAARRERRLWLESLTARPAPRKEQHGP